MERNWNLVPCDRDPEEGLGKATGEGAAQFHWRRQYHQVTTVVSSSCGVGLKAACTVDGRVGEVVLSIDFPCPEVHEAET